MPQVDRLLDLRHASRLDQLEAAFRALGKQLFIQVCEAAGEERAPAGDPGGNSLSFELLGLDPTAPTRPLPPTTRIAVDTTNKIPRIPSLRYHCRELAVRSLESVRATATA
jgi:hypothetical protein